MCGGTERIARTRLVCTIHFISARVHARAHARKACETATDALCARCVTTATSPPVRRRRRRLLQNLISALVLAATLELPEVCIWMESTLLRGNRTVKVNSSGLDAFESPK